MCSFEGIFMLRFCYELGVAAVFALWVFGLEVVFSCLLRFAGLILTV